MVSSAKGTDGENFMEEEEEDEDEDEDDGLVVGRISGIEV